MKQGVTLKEFAALQALGETAAADPLTEELLLKQPDKLHKTKSIEDLTFSDFVDLEKYFIDTDYINFCNIFVIDNKNVYIHNLWHIVGEFSKQKEELKQKYYYVFDPPIYGEPQKETVGTELRKDFVNEFGPYVVLMDLVCKGDWTKYKEIEQWKVSEFLFVANYLSGQRIIENVK